MADPEPGAAPPTPSGAPTPSTNTRGRQLGIVAVLAVAGAGLVAIAAALTWWSADYVDPLTGALTIKATGADGVPELIPLALVALAGFGAALATRGIPRRVVGVVIALCGAALAARSAAFFGSTPQALVGELTRPADPVGAAQLHPVGPVLGVLGGLLLAVAGVLIAFGVGARQAMGSRYERAAKARAATAKPTDQGDWWKALDAGDDPTAVSAPDGPDVTAPAVGAPDGPDVTAPAVGTPDSPDVTPPAVSTPDSPDVTTPAVSTPDGPDVTAPAVGAPDGPDVTPTAVSTPDSPDVTPPAVSEHTSRDGYHDPNASRSS